MSKSLKIHLTVILFLKFADIIVHSNKYRSALDFSSFSYTKATGFFKRYKKLYTTLLYSYNLYKTYCYNLYITYC